MRRIALILLLALGCRSRETHPAGYKVPPGFHIEAAASVQRLGASAGLVFDHQGRPVILPDKGPALVLTDRNNDGRFETATALTLKVTGVRGLWFDPRAVYLLGNGPEGNYGLHRLNSSGDDVELLSPLEAPSPGPHDIQRGPDGALTLLHGGRWLRWNEERRAFTVLAGGFEVGRAHAYTRDGEGFLSDEGDNRRLVHLLPGADYREPGKRFDTLPDLRRSPASGLEFYHHSVYPETFEGALFQAEGQPGRIVARRIERAGATYRVLESVIGEFVLGRPYGVTGIKVGPDGFVYFTTAGPDGSGGLFRIRYTPTYRQRWQTWRARVTVTLVRQPQPLSPWGHATLQRQRDLLEARWGYDLEDLAQDKSETATDRSQALLLLERFGPRPNLPLLKTLLADQDPRVRAATLYAAGQNPGAASLGVAALADPDPLVRRRAAQALQSQYEPAVYSLLSDSDRFVRYAARLALEQMPRDQWQSRVMEESDQRVAIEGMLALIHAGGERRPVLQHLLSMLASPGPSQAVRLDMLRLFSLAASEVEDTALQKRAAEVLLNSGDEMSRELASALSWAGGTDVIGRVLDALGEAKNDHALQVHYAACLRSIKTGWTAGQKEEMLEWFRAASRWPETETAASELGSLFSSFLGNVLTREETRAARRKVPKLAAAGGRRSQTASDIYDLVVSGSAPAGNPRRGRTIFVQKCASCHRAGGVGTNYGPDLTEIARRDDKAEILEAILWPSRHVPQGYVSLELELEDGSRLEGMLLREDKRGLLLKTATEPRPISIFKRRIKDRRSTQKSIMPEGLLDDYDVARVAGLLAFLQSGGK